MVVGLLDYSQCQTVKNSSVLFIKINIKNKHKNILVVKSMYADFFSISRTSAGIRLTVR